VCKPAAVQPAQELHARSKGYLTSVMSMSLSNAGSCAAEYSCMFVGLFVAASHRTRRRRREEFPGVGSLEEEEACTLTLFLALAQHLLLHRRKYHLSVSFPAFPPLPAPTTDATTTNTCSLLQEPPAIERVCCLLVLNSVTSTPQWIRQPMRLCICRSRSVCSCCVPYGCACVCTWVCVCTIVKMCACTSVYVCVRCL
jgi:hypothetical protein